MLKLTLLALISGLLFAQTPPPHTVTLKWQDAQNPAGTTYNAYRAAGACSASSVFTLLNPIPVSAMIYVDSGMSPGAYCYVVRAVATGLESDNSNTADAAVRPFSVTVTTTVGR